MCGSVSGCGSGSVSKEPEYAFKINPNPIVDQIIDDLINDHKKAIAKLTKVRSLVKASKSDDIKKAIKEFVDKL